MVNSTWELFRSEDCVIFNKISTKVPKQMKIFKRSQKCIWCNEVWREMEALRLHIWLSIMIFLFLCVNKTCNDYGFQRWIECLMHIEKERTHQPKWMQSEANFQTFSETKNMEFFCFCLIKLCLNMWKLSQNSNLTN